MRLTLRTMLAYLDDILEPADAQELGKKIEESEFAGNLVHRIRGSMRRLRLGAPKLEGRGMGLDANSVAEYLDNTLPKDRVPDFEKVCLESDVHLAEAASCHQILTLVLGEPAEIDPGLRERMYRLVSPTVSGRTSDEPVETKALRVDAPAAAAAAVTPPPVAGEPVAPPVAEPATKSKRPKPEVPDYLRARSGRRLWSLALTVVLVFLLVGASMMAIGGGSLSWLFGPVQQVATNQPATSSPAVPTAPEVPPPAAPAVESSPESAPAPPGTPPANEDVANNLNVPASLTIPPAVEAPPADRPGEAAEPAPIPPVPDTIAPKPPAGESEVASAAGAASPDAVPPVPPGEGMVVGHFISEDQVLARFNPADQTWLRVPVRGAVSVGDRILALPTFRPQIMLTGDVQLTVSGDTQLTLGPLEQGAIPQVNVRHGRAVVATVGRAGTRVGLQLAGRRGMATFGDADSVLAVEVVPYFLPGTDPKTPAHVLARVYSLSGQIQWQEGDMETVVIAAGLVRESIDDQTAKIAPAGALPKWIEGRDQSDIDRRASLTLEPLLVADRPLSLSLEERADDRRVEVKSLAIRCLASMDRFDRAVDALRNEELKSYWPAHYDSLQAALARGPDTAALVMSSLEKIRGAEATVLYRMLWGYSPADLEKGSAAQLVDYLDNESLDFRVLAIENLRRITGVTLLYRPELTAARRKISIQQWKARLAEGQVVYRAAGSEPPVEPTTEPAPDAGGTQLPL